MDESGPGPQILTPCASARKTSIGVSNSPEFEFCNYIPQSPDLVYAAQLFSGGVLLPLHRLHQSDESPPPEAPFWSDLGPPEPEIIYAPQLPATSIRWRDIFKKNDKRSSRRRSIDIESEKEIITSFMEMKKREKRNSTGGGSVNAATELNINLWPFSRSRSTGNGAARPRSGDRKVSSAPCSRSNSTSESKSRSCPGSPGRGGVHVGRTSHVSQVRRGGGGGRRSNDAVVRNKGLPGSGDGRSKAKVLNLNLPRFIGHRQHLSCKSDGNGGGGGSVSGEGVRGSSSFNIKSLFTKKV